MLAITTDSFAGYGLDRIFSFVAEAKLDGVEIVIRHGDFDSYDSDYLKSLSKRYKVPIIGISTPVNNMSAEKASKVVNLAEEVGADFVTLTPPDIFDFNYKKWIKEEIKPLQKKKKVHIGLINPPFKTFLGILPKFAFNNIFDLKGLDDLVFDVNNAASKSEPLLEVYSVLKQNIKYIHLSNTHQDHDHTLLPNGNLPLESFLTRLTRDKFKGPIALKLNPKALEVGKIDKMMDNLNICKKFIKKYFPEI